MPGEHSGRVEKSLDYLAWHWIMQAVLDVFHQNQMREREGCPIRAKSDCWCSNKRLRKDVHKRAMKFWCDLTGCDHTYFPYSVDGVARLYFKIRKRQVGEVEGFDAEVGEACQKSKPQNSLFGEGE